MLKKIVIIISVFFITGCISPTASLLGPTLTGVTTKSAARTFVSFESKRIVKRLDILNPKVRIKKSKISVSKFVFQLISVLINQRNHLSIL